MLQYITYIHQYYIPYTVVIWRFLKFHSTPSCVRNKSSTSETYPYSMGYTLCVCLATCHFVFSVNRPAAQTLHCTSPISHNAPLCNRNVHMCAYCCYKVAHCGIFVNCTVGFVRGVYKTNTGAICLRAAAQPIHCAFGKKEPLELLHNTELLYRKTSISKYILQIDNVSIFYIVW